MSCRFANRSIPFLSLLVITLILFFFFSSSSFACIDALEHNTNNSDGAHVFDIDMEDAGHEVLTRWENDDDIKRRSLVEDAKSSSPMILAQQRTLRKDPSDHFRLYTGGWNLTDSHYWASAIFTAVPFFVIAAVWFAVFGITLLLVCLCSCCCRRKPARYSHGCYVISLTFLVLLTVATIVGCIFLYYGQAKFFDSLIRTVQYIGSQVTLISEKLKSVTQILSRIKGLGLDTVTPPPEMVNGLNKAEKALDSANNRISEGKEKIMKAAYKYLTIARLSLNILAAVMLVLSLVGLVFAVLGLECLVYILVVFGWILVTLTFILCGLFLGIHNLVADSCVAIGEWADNPQAHTSVDDFLPCLDKSISQGILGASQVVTSGLVGMVDAGIATVANDQAVLNYNQSGPPVPTVCIPFNADLTNRTCEKGEVEMSNASEVLKNYMCEAKEVEGGSQVCVTTGRLTPRLYSQMDSALNLSNTLNIHVPFFAELPDCTYVRKVCRDLNQNICPGLDKYSEWIHSGLLDVSVAVMCSLIFWVIFARERIYTKKNTANVAKANPMTQHQMHPYQHQQGHPHPHPYPYQQQQQQGFPMGYPAYPNGYHNM